MDTSKALQALASGKLVDMIDALDWDERFDFKYPGSDAVGTVARTGATLVALDSDGDVMLIPHQDAESASACFAMKRDQVGQMLAFVGVLHEAHAAYTASTAQVPDDVSSLTGDV